MPKKAVGYIRISQEDENPENQRIKIAEFCSANGLELVNVFVDLGVSGATPPRERPGYRSMLEYCRACNIKDIVFYDVSRLGRNLEETLYELKRLIEEGYNVWFVYPDFLNRLNDPMMKKFIVSMLAWFAELYRYDIIRRTKDALERARREGKRLGRPPKVPPETIKRYLEKYYRKMGLSLKDVLRIMKGDGYDISYDTLLRWKKKLGF